MSGQAPIIEPDGIGPEAFARAVGAAPDSQLRAGLESPFRKVVLDGVFERMVSRLRAERARGVDAVVHWRIGGRPDGGHDLYEVAIRERTCTVAKETTQRPRLIITIDGVDFLKLVTGNANGARLLVSRRLRVRGDVLFAARLQRLFRLPGAGEPPPA